MLAWAVPISVLTGYIGARLAATRMSTATLRYMLAAAIIGTLAYRALRQFV